MTNAVVGGETYPRLLERQQDAAEGDAIAPAYCGLSLETGTADGVA